MTRRSPLLGIIQPPASKSLQRASPPRLTTMPPKTREDPSKGTLNKPSFSSRAMVVPALSAASLRMALTSPEARQTSQGSPVHGRSCLGDRETLGRAARREPKASRDRALPGPASGARGLALRAFEDQRQEAAPEEPRTIWQLDGPLLAMPSKETNRGASILQLQKTYAGDPSGPSSTTRSRRPATSSTSRSSPSAELRCDPRCL